MTTTPATFRISERAVEFDAYNNAWIYNEKTGWWKCFRGRYFSMASKMYDTHWCHSDTRPTHDPRGERAGGVGAADRLVVAQYILSEFAKVQALAVSVSFQDPLEATIHCDNGHSRRVTGQFAAKLKQAPDGQKLAADLAEAMRGVLRIADRKTDEFDAARGALKNYDAALAPRGDGVGRE